jgi:hypothetical protein
VLALNFVAWDSWNIGREMGGYICGELGGTYRIGRVQIGSYKNTPMPTPHDCFDAFAAGFIHTHPMSERLRDDFPSNWTDSAIEAWISVPSGYHSFDEYNQGSDLKTADANRELAFFLLAPSGNFGTKHFLRFQGLLGTPAKNNI